MVKSKTNSNFLVVAFLYGFLFIFIFPYLHKNNLAGIIFGYSLLFATFIVSNKFLANVETRILLGFGIFYRVLTMGGEPALSDDWFRFAWDGYLSSQFLNPYFAIPEALFLNSAVEKQSNLFFFYQNMNSQKYLSVYPLGIQSIFAIPWVLPLGKFHFVYQCILLFFEIVNLILIKNRNLFSNYGYWFYCANPLLVVESVSQIHIEPILLTFILYMERFYLRGNHLAMIVSYIGAIYIKLTALFLFPVLWTKTNSVNKKYLMIALSLAFLPYLYLIGSNLNDHGKYGIGLFFHSFRFNGLFDNIIWFFLRAISKDFTYLSGIISITLLILLLIYFSFKNKSSSLQKNLILSFAVIFVFSPTVHPWYVIPLFAFTNSIKNIQLNTIISYLLCLSYCLYSFRGEWSIFYFNLAASLIILGSVYGRKCFDYFRKTIYLWKS
jgi:alpha-1,6-mannosyltransferase